MTTRGALTRGLFWVACFTASRRSLAEEHPQAQLRYEREGGTESCPDEDELRHAVAARLGYEPFSAGSKRVVSVRVTRRPRELVGRVEIHDENGALKGSRELTSPTKD